MLSCYICKKQFRIDAIRRHLSTHAKNWVKTAPLERLEYIVQSQIPIIYDYKTDGGIRRMLYASCLICKNGSIKDSQRGNPQYFIDTHKGNECCKRFNEVKHLFTDEITRRKHEQEKTDKQKKAEDAIHTVHFASTEKEVPTPMMSNEIKHIDRKPVLKITEVESPHSDSESDTGSDDTSDTESIHETSFEEPMEEPKEEPMEEPKEEPKEETPISYIKRPVRKATVSRKLL
jgi:hypothetical protein